MNGDVKIVDDVPTAFAKTVEQAFENRPNPDRFTLALSGGSTAAPCYEALIDTNIDWTKVTIVWGDERLVPLEHDDSNFALAERVLLSKVGKTESVYPMTQNGGADSYNNLIASLLPIDVVHLGMGDDGHTASLFPDSPALDTPPGTYVVETGDDLHKHPRMTFTFDAIAKSSLALFTVVGEAKREMFAKVSAGEDFPATHVTANSVVWLVDHAAAQS